MKLNKSELLEHLKDDIFRIISEEAEKLELECYVIGGYFRDIFLKRESKAIDVVTVGSGISLASAVFERLGKNAHISAFINLGTEQAKHNALEVEFVGPRKESNTNDSRRQLV